MYNNYFTGVSFSCASFKHWCFAAVGTRPTFISRDVISRRRPRTKLAEILTNCITFCCALTTRLHRTSFAWLKTKNSLASLKKIEYTWHGVNPVLENSPAGHVLAQMVSLVGVQYSTVADCGVHCLQAQKKFIP